MQTNICGGSRETLVNEVAVIPRIPERSDFVVTTVTPLAQSWRASLNSSALTVIIFTFLLLLYLFAKRLLGRDVNLADRYSNIYQPFDLSNFTT
jgi:hypothetical protein